MRTQLNGYIVADDDAWLYRFFGYAASSPADIRKAVAENPPGETLTVEINSPGGDMFAGFEMYSVLRGAQCDTEAEVQSMAASAASTAMLGCNRVRASPVAQVMVHNPMLRADGNQYDHQKTAETLAKFAQSVLNAYELKCQGKKTRAELEAMMDKETWFPVQEAVEAGLVDEIIGGAGLLAPQAISCVGSGLRALCGAGGLPSAAELRAKKAALDARGEQSGGGPAEEPDQRSERERLTVALSVKKYY